MLSESFRVTSGHRANTRKDSHDLFGIELEYEQCTVAPEAMSKWSFVRDNSLRDGLELVSVPLKFKQLDAALAEAEKAVIALNYKATQRCGLHVHLNMRTKTLGQVFNFITLYALLEPTIFRTYADGRADSNFCVPLYLNQSLVKDLSLEIAWCRRKQQRGWRSMSKLIHSAKYSAINLQALGVFGTLEMRQAYCTTDFKAIRRWITFLDYMNQKSLEYSDPQNIVTQYSKVSLSRLQLDFFGQAYRIDQKIQQKAYDSAALIAGYTPTNWKAMTWKKPTLKETV